MLCSGRLVAWEDSGNQVMVIRLNDQSVALEIPAGALLSNGDTTQAVVTGYNPSQ